MMPPPRRVRREPPGFQGCILRVMRSENLGGLDAVITGGSDGNGGGDGPVIVLLHGFGAPGDDLVPLAEVFAHGLPGVRWVFPAAPLELPMGFGDARAWWMIDMA